MATLNRSRRPRGSAAQVWFVELAMALALFTIAAAVVEPSVFGGSPEFSTAADGQAPDTGPTKPARATAAPSSSPPASDHVYDTVITGGRVMDPESGYDRVANVGI